VPLSVGTPLLGVSGIKPRDKLQMILGSRVGIDRINKKEGAVQNPP
jgi:hypothetical protein